MKGLDMRWSPQVRARIALIVVAFTSAVALTYGGYAELGLSLFSVVVVALIGVHFYSNRSSRSTTTTWQTRRGTVDAVVIDIDELLALRRVWSSASVTLVLRDGVMIPGVQLSDIPQVPPPIEVRYETQMSGKNGREFRHITFG